MPDDEIDYENCKHPRWTVRDGYSCCEVCDFTPGIDD